MGRVSAAWSRALLQQLAWGSKVLGASEKLGCAEAALALPHYHSVTGLALICASGYL